MMLVIVVGLALLGLLHATASRLIRANAASGEHLADVATLGTLGQQFRRDVRAAVNIEASPPDAAMATLRLGLADGSQVEYRIDGTRLRRTQSSDGKPTRYEDYALRRMSVLRWKDTSGQNHEVAMTIGREGPRPAGAGGAPRTFEIVAVARGERTGGR
jgi:hypothetical protein